MQVRLGASEKEVSYQISSAVWKRKKVRLLCIVQVVEWSITTTRGSLPVWVNASVCVCDLAKVEDGSGGGIYREMKWINMW